jgi:hypothetical protein
MTPFNIESYGKRKHGILHRTIVTELQPFGIGPHHAKVSRN